MLRKSEKHMKTDMVYLTKGGSWLTFGQVVSSAASFLLAIAFANLLPRETYGTYKYILSIVALLSIPTLKNMGTAITQAAAQGYEGSFIPALKTKIKWGLLGGLASILLAGYYYFQGNTTLTLCFLIATVFLPLMDSLNLYGSLLNGRKLFDINTKFAIITQIIAVAIMVLVLFLTNNIFLVVFTYFISHALLRFIFLKITLKKYKPNEKRDPKTIPYGKHLSLINVINNIAAYLDRILVFHYLGAVELAIYSFAIAFPEQIKGALKSLSILALPKFSQRNISEIKAGMKSKIIKLFLFGILIIGVYIAAAPFIYKIFFPQYKESIFYSQLFALSMLNLPFSFFPTILQAKMKVKEQYISNTVSAILSIVTMFIFIIWLGLLGLIIARIINRFLGVLISFLLYLKAFSDTEK